MNCTMRSVSRIADATDATLSPIVTARRPGSACVAGRFCEATLMSNAIPAAVANALADDPRALPPRMRRTAATARDLTGAGEVATPDTGAGNGTPRTSSITRRFEAGSIAIGSRRSSMNDASGSGPGRWSDTIHPLKDLTQSIARPLDAHLERRHPGTRDGGHFFVAEPLDVVQQERLALFCAELR